MPAGDPERRRGRSTSSSGSASSALEDGRHARGNDQVFVGGAAFMAERFDAIEQVRAVLGILEQSYVVVTLLRDVLAQGESVSIGSEHAGHRVPGRVLARRRPL